MAIPKDTLGLAGEFAVASELCRRGIYAQLTLGNRKRTDLLVETERQMIRVQVKAEQERVWPGVKGVHGKDIILVLVDYQGKGDLERPDFYILSAVDWERVVTKELQDTGKVKCGEVTLSPQNVPHWKDGYVGMGARATQVEPFKEAWEKVVDLVGRAA
jgi:hypothetical protein